jgi:putative FmdB family regulatory protein
MIYEFQCNKCGHLWEENLPIARRNEPLDGPCPNCKKKGGVEKQFVTSICYDTKSSGAISRTPDSFNDLLKNMKKHAGRNNTINVK